MQPDARLIELTREGHERAFEEIVRRYRAPLTGFAATIVPAHRAEDVVQETFTKALEAIKADEREISLKAWLYTIVRNRSLNSVRDEPTHEEIDPQHDGVPQPPDVAARRAEVASLVVGLQALPEPQRKAIVQRELEGRGHEQIASNLGVSSGAVRQLIFRARTNLREGFGALIPLPVLRQILDSAAVRVGGVDAALVGSTGAVGFKLGVAVLASGAAIGGGVALRPHHGDRTPGPAQAEAAVTPHPHRGATGREADARASAPARQQASSATNREQGDGRAVDDDRLANNVGPSAGQHVGEAESSNSGSSSTGSQGGSDSGSEDHGPSNSGSGSDHSGHGGDHGPSGEGGHEPSDGSGGPRGGDSGSGHSGSGDSGSGGTGHQGSGGSGGSEGGGDPEPPEGEDPPESGGDDPPAGEGSSHSGHGDFGGGDDGEAEG